MIRLSGVLSPGLMILWALLALLMPTSDASAMPAQGGDHVSTAESPSSGGALIFGTPGEARSLDPGVLQEKTSALVTVSIYENLVRFDRESFKIRPALATSWNTGSNGRQWTFLLRKNVRFHDGTIFDAWAVKFNYDRQLDPRHPYHFPGYGRFLMGRSLFGNGRELIEKVDVLDPLTIRFTLSRPCLPFLRMLALYPFAIVSPAAVKKWKDDYYCHPVGTGPFRFLEWRKEQRIVLLANRDYWGTRPYLERIIFEPFSDNISCQRQMERNNIDFMANVAFGSVEELKQNPDITVAHLSSSNLAYVAINCQRAPYNRKSFRLELNRLVNRREIAEILGGAGVIPATGPLPPGMMGYTPPKGEPPAPAAKRSGKPGEIHSPLLIYPDTIQPYLNDPGAVAAKICSQLKRGGLKAQSQKLPYGEFTRKIRYGEYDLALWGTVDETGDPDTFLVLPWDPLNAVPGGTNICFYLNRALHAMLWKARSTENQVQRRTLYGQIAQQITLDSPMIPLVYSHEVVAYSKKLRGMGLNPSGLYDLTTVWIEK